MMSIDAVTDFVSTLRQHYSTPKRSEAEEVAWVRSLVHALREYVPSELKFAAEEIIKTRTLRYFPLPKECLDACKHARNMIRMRAELQEHKAKEEKGEPDKEPGADRRAREDRAWAAKMRAKGARLRCDIEGYDPADWCKPR